MNIDSTEIYEDVPNTEIIEDSEVQNAQGKEDVSQDLQTDSSENGSSAISAPATGSTVQNVDYSSNLDSIANDVHVIMFILLFSFCWSCMKSWRTHSLKGVRK
mgnify:CR=1 FL=1